MNTDSELSMGHNELHQKRVLIRSWLLGALTLFASHNALAVWQCSGICVLPNTATATELNACADKLMNIAAGTGITSDLQSIHNPTHVCHDRFTAIVAANPGWSGLVRRRSYVGNIASCWSHPGYESLKCAGALRSSNPKCPDGEIYDPASYQCLSAAGKPDNPCTDPSSTGPIYFGSGNKFLESTDFAVPGVSPLRWSRVYNGADGIWRFPYHQRLEIISTKRVRWRKEDGKVREFAYNGTDSAWDAQGDITEQLIDLPGSTDWEIRRRDDAVERFDAVGKLLSITNRAGQTTTIAYSGSEILSVTNHANQTVLLSHDSNGRLSSVTDPEGDVIEYEYDANGMLEYVVYPDNTPGTSSDNPRLQYHYEDLVHTDLVTGITDESGVRYSTYAYDSSRRATLSERSGPSGSVESTSVVYNSDGTVTVTNALGKQATYGFEVLYGSRKLVSVAGSPTPLCLATTRSITYDSRGHVNTMTDENGVVTDYDYDNRGLVYKKIEAVGTSEERTTSTTWHSEYRVPTLIQEPGRTTQLDYDSGGRLEKRTVKD